MIEEGTNRKLEDEADRLLQEDARAQGFIKRTYGYGKYAKRYGILTDHDIATIRHHEFPSDFARIQRTEDEAD